MNYPMYPNNQYNNQYYMQSLQDMRNNIDSQMRQLQTQQQTQQQSPTNLTQNFQLAPQNNNELECKYANNIDDVKNTFVMRTGIFVNKDFTSMWIKSTDGNVRIFKTEEVIEMDDRDKEIMSLKRQIQEMKEMIANESNVNNTIIDEPDESKSTTKLSNNKRINAK